MDAQKILIIGASCTSYGGIIADGLEKEGHEIYTAQRKSRSSQSDTTEINYDRWCDTDLEKPQQSVLVCSQLDSLNVKLDAVICASIYNESASFDGITTFDLSRAITVGILEPLMLIKHLIDFQVLRWDGKVIFLLDSRTFDRDRVHIELSKAGLQAMVAPFLDRLAVTLEYTFLMLPLKEQQGSGDVSQRHVCDLVSEKREFRHKQSEEVR